MTELEMTGFLIKLADYGITGVKVVYEGSGDSGAIEGIWYTKESCLDPDDVDDNVDDWGDEDLASLDQEIYKKLQDFAYHTLLNDIEDWYNNDGGFGRICICVPSGQYTTFNNVRIVSSEPYTHEGKLTDDSVD